tara:strand:- start:1947 stop:3419 length:1473 start_codon:yes stop_codon:yes gene_type:complete
MAKVSKSIILAYNKCADLAIKWTNILDSYWHKDEKIPFSALEQIPITNIDGKVDKVEGKKLSANDYTDVEKQKLSLLKILSGYFDTGIRAAGTLKTIIGDFDNSGNGTKITIDDENKQTTLDFETLLINTIADGLSNAVKASIYQKETGGDKSANEVNTFRDFVRNAVFSTATNYTNQVIRLVDNADDNSTGGTKITEIINRKTGAGNLLYQYVFDIKNELHNGEIGFLNGAVVRNSVLGTEAAKVLTVMRAISPITTVDNPNAEVHFPQVMHPSLALKNGTIKQGGQVLFLDIDVTTANLGTTLVVAGDIAYLEGGGGSDVAAFKTYLEGLGHKLRFIKHDGTSESDFKGIINYLGDVSQLEDATNKVLINKEYFESKKRSINFNNYSNLKSGVGHTLSNNDQYIESDTGNGLGLEIPLGLNINTSYTLLAKTNITITPDVGVTITCIDNKTNTSSVISTTTTTPSVTISIGSAELIATDKVNSYILIR